MGDEYKWCCVEKVFYWHHYLVVSWSLHREVHLPLGAWGTSREHWIIRLCVRSQYMIAHHPPRHRHHHHHHHHHHTLHLNQHRRYIHHNQHLHDVRSSNSLSLLSLSVCWANTMCSPGITRGHRGFIMMTIRNGVYNSKDGIVRLSNHRFLPE